MFWFAGYDKTVLLTAEFRKTVEGETFKAVAPLLKKYQEEVDRLTNRSKDAEGAFLEIFKKLQEAPDPVSVLDASLSQASKIAELESHAAKVSAELDEYKQESKELKNQDLTIRRLEEMVRDLQEDIRQKDEEIEAAKVSAAAELHARSADEAREREERLEAELSRAEDALDAMKRLYSTTQSQLLTIQERGEEAAAAARSESELAMAEVERAEQRLAQLSRERDMLLDKMKPLEEGKDGEEDAVDKSYLKEEESELRLLRDELRSQQDTVVKLRDELSRASSQLTKERNSFESKIEGLQSSLAANEAHVQALEAQLQGRPSQEQMHEARMQIRMLKAILQNSAVDEDDAHKDLEGNEDMLNISSMEAALLEKNRKLESDLTLVRIQLSEANETVDHLSNKLREAEEELNESKGLVLRLEMDLENATRVSQESTNVDDQSTQSVITRSASGVVSGDDDRSIVKALSAQRDRLKTRISQLEGELSSTTIELDHAKQAAKSAKNDNVTLVERLKFVEGYIGRGARPPSSDVESGGGIIAKYIKDYEESVNPFTGKVLECNDDSHSRIFVLKLIEMCFIELADFRVREKEARRRKMPIQDRAAYAVGSAFISGNKIARSAIVVYALVLHFIAFIVLAG